MYTIDEFYENIGVNVNDDSTPTLMTEFDTKVENSCTQQQVNDAVGLSFNDDVVITSVMDIGNDDALQRIQSAESNGSKRTASDASIDSLSTTVKITEEKSSTNPTSTGEKSKKKKPKYMDPTASSTAIKVTRKRKGGTSHKTVTRRKNKKSPKRKTIKKRKMPKRNAKTRRQRK